jgi:hypothetical protein
VALRPAQLGFWAHLAFWPVATKTGEVVHMASEWQRRPISTATGDEVGQGRRLDLHGEEGNLIWGSRESRSSPGDQSTMAAVQAEGINGDGIVRWSGRSAPGPWSSMERRRSSGSRRRWWMVAEGAESMVWCPRE